MGRVYKLTLGPFSKQEVCVLFIQLTCTSGHKLLAAPARKAQSVPAETLSLATDEQASAIAMRMVCEGQRQPQH